MCDNKQNATATTFLNMRFQNLRVGVSMPHGTMCSTSRNNHWIQDSRLFVVSYAEISPAAKQFFRRHFRPSHASAMPRVCKHTLCDFETVTKQPSALPGVDHHLTQAPDMSTDATRLSMHCKSPFATSCRRFQAWTLARRKSPICQQARHDCPDPEYFL
jgi:hypothetical protein